MEYAELCAKKLGELREKKDATILAIETSCDETAAAIVKNGREVVADYIHTQIPIHAAIRRGRTRNSFERSP